MTALVLVHVDSTDRAVSDALLAALAGAGAIAEDDAAEWTMYRVTAGTRRVTVVDGFADAGRVRAVLGNPSVRQAMDAAGALTTPSVRVFEEVHRSSGTSPRRTGWLHGVSRVVALPGGVPPGRARPEPAEHSTQ